LRSLTRHANKTGTVFADPTTRNRISTPRDEPVIVPLTDAQLDDAIQAAFRTDAKPGYRICPIAVRFRALIERGSR
jgi:hypothetical protein